MLVVTHHRLPGLNEDNIGSDGNNNSLESQVEVRATAHLACPDDCLRLMLVSNRVLVESLT